MEKLFYLRITAGLENDHTFISLKYNDQESFITLVQNVRKALDPVDLENMRDPLDDITLFNRLRVDWQDLFVSELCTTFILLEICPVEQVRQSRWWCDADNEMSTAFWREVHYPHIAELQGGLWIHG